MASIMRFSGVSCSVLAVRDAEEGDRCRVSGVGLVEDADRCEVSGVGMLPAGFPLKDDREYAAVDSRLPTTDSRLDIFPFSSVG